MKRIFSNIILITLLGAAFLGAMMLNSRFLNRVSLDLTEQQIYSLSLGSKKIAQNIDGRITLTLFFSEQSSVGMTAIRDYKARVESLLHEYVKLSGGNISLETINTAPFSEAQDTAAQYGLTKALSADGQSELYFGLTGTNLLDDTMVIGFFDPAKEGFLEYDISRLLHQLNNPKPVQLTIVSDLEIAGGQNPLTGETRPAYVLYQQLQDVFEVSLISNSDEKLPSNTQVLMLWHPQNLNTPLLQDIDQFLMRNGKALALLDAHFESDPLAQMGSVGVNSSDFPLLASYGVEFDSTKVVLDAGIGLEVRNPEDGISRHFGFLGLGAQQINADDIISADLDTINGASFGILSLAPNSELNETILLSSSNASDTIQSERYMGTRNPTVLSDSFSNSDKRFTLAARYTGFAKSHFTSTGNENAALVQTNNLNLAVIADVDISADRFWVTQSNFFGEHVFNQFANNGDFILNTLENLSGNENLIGIRSRGTFVRPFTRVQDIQVLAEEKFREQEKRLQIQLEQTETKLATLQTQVNNVALSDEQEAAIAEFTEQRIEIRKSLRDVQFQLQKDIEQLGNILKAINIVGAPLGLVLLLFLFAKALRKRAPRVQSNSTDVSPLGASD